MSALQAKIDSLEAEIEGYRNDLSVATAEARKDKLFDIITERGKTLNALLTQQQQQQQQQGGKFYSVLVGVCVYLLVISWCIREQLRRQWGVYHNITPPIRDSTSRWCVWIKVCAKKILWVFAFRFFSYVFN